MGPMILEFVVCSLTPRWSHARAMPETLQCHKVITNLVIGELTHRSHHHEHDDVIKWKHFPRYWPFVRGIHRSPVNSPHKGQWRGALMFSLICARINGWVNTGEAGGLRRYRAHYDVIVMNVVKIKDSQWDMWSEGSTLSGDVSGWFGLRYDHSITPGSSPELLY